MNEQEDLVIAQFTAALEARGILPPKRLIADGKIHRCGTLLKPKGMGGSYLLHLDSRPAGGYENFMDGDGWWTWKAEGLPEPTAEQRAARRAHIEAAMATREAEKERRWMEGCKLATALWMRAPVCPKMDRHPYLIAKRVLALGIRRNGDSLMIPVRQGRIITSIQYIKPDGQKRFLPNATVQGGYHPIGVPKGKIYIAEGYATAATVHMATGEAVAVAFDCGNLIHAATTLRARLPWADFIFAADDDPSGIGEEHAHAAAAAVGGRVILPMWGGSRSAGDTDFNDCARIHGLGTVAEMLL